MRLGTLLGSAAIVLASGSAFAADFSPVVAPSAAGASYLEQCPAPAAAPAPENPPAAPPAPGGESDAPSAADAAPAAPAPGPAAPAGFMKPGTEWCLTLVGSATWSSSFGMEIVSGSVLGPAPAGTVDWTEAWALTPADAVATEIGGDGWSGFGFGSKLTLLATTTSSLGPVTININVVGDDDTQPFVSVGPWTFSETQVTYSRTAGMLGFTISAIQPGWGEAGPYGEPIRAGTIMAGAPGGIRGPAASWGVAGLVALAPSSPGYVAASSGSYVPETRIPDIEGLVTYGGPMDSLQAALNAYWGQRDAGIATAYPAVAALGEFDTYGASFGITFRNAAPAAAAPAGPPADGPPQFRGTEFQLGAAADRTVLDALGAPYIGWTYAVRGAARYTGDRIGFTLEGVVGFDSGIYTSYKYVDQPPGTYWLVSGRVDVDLTEEWAVAFTAAYNDGPATTNDDGVLRLGSRLTVNPFDTFEVTAGVTYDRLQTGTTALAGSLGASIRF